MTFFTFVRKNARFLGAGAALTFCSSFGQTFFISIFAGKILSDYGLSHGAWGGLYTLATMASAAVMLWAGTLSDTVRVRVLGPVGLMLLAGACLLMAISPGIATLMLAVFLLRFLGQGMMGHVANVAMARWFVRTRGRALAIAAMGFSFGEAILPLGFVSLMAFFDWRLLWVLAALFPLALVPVMRAILRLERTPQSIAAETPSLGMGQQHWTRQEALGNRLFWMIFPAVFGTAAFGTALLFFQVHLAETKGWAHVQLVALFPLYTASAIIASLAIGALMDRYGALAPFPFFLLPMSAFFFLVPTIDSVLLMAIPMILFGIVQGCSNTLITGFTSEIYGTKYIGSIKSALTAVMVLGSAVGPGLCGWLIDQGVVFERQMPWIGAYFLAVTGLLLLVARRARAALAPAF